MKDSDILIAVVDGQGGGIGKAIIEKLHKALPAVTIRALGTNSVATNRMLRAGATDGATGENAIVHNANKAHIIMGVVAILAGNSLLGEMTPKMAEAIGTSNAYKIVVPVERCGIRVAVPFTATLQQYIDASVLMAEQYVKAILE